MINSRDCSTCLFSWYGLLNMVGGVGGDFSQTPMAVICSKLIDDGYLV